MSCNRCDLKFCTYKIPIFKNLDCDEVDEIFKIVEHKEYLKGEILFNEDDIVDSLYIINEGKLKIYKYTKNGKEQILHILNEGDFWGEMHLLKEKKAKVYAKAIEDCNLSKLNKKIFKEFLLKKPEVAIKVLEGVSEKLEHLENLATTLADNDGDTKLAYLLIEFSNKYGVNVDKKIEIDLPITREEMANFTGLTRETVSRKLKNFEKLKLIKMIGNKKIEIINYEELNDLI